jgi:UDP-N-acetylglucosamine 2-epimerase (non-hydrolysing)
MTVVGTRPELIKLARVIPELDAHFGHTLVHTGQNFDHSLKDVFFRDLDIREPDYYLDAAGGNATETIAQVLSRIDSLLGVVMPDAFLVLGDTNSSFAAIAAKKRKIPIFHMEAGNRCFDERVPEEVNRRIVDHISDINLVYTEHARRHLISEGLPPDRIIKTGSPMREILHHHQARIDESNVLQRFGLQARQFFLLSLHREENVDNQRHLQLVVESLGLIESTRALEGD